MSFVSISKQILTNGFNDCHDITKEVEDAVDNSGIASGLVTVFVPGSTAGVTTIEFEEGAVNDFKEAIEKLIPQGIPYKHNIKWGDGNGFSHVRGAFMGPSLTIPLNDGALQLGQWQQIMLVDFDNKKRDRKYLVNILGE
ncbi:MAG: secondary thiamine-phosphate synthase enzyme YjbQ [Candidatus Anammoxibacter sp.]